MFIVGLLLDCSVAAFDQISSMLIEQGLNIQHRQVSSELSHYFFYKP